MTPSTSPTFNNPSASTSFQRSSSGDPESRRAPSVISSRMTDIASEDGNQDVDTTSSTVPMKARRDRISAGSSAMNYSRPPSAAQNSSQRDTWSQPPPSRRGLPQTGGLSGLRGGVLSGASGRLISGTNRSHSVSSRTSKTHVPSVASQAFFRPMSSQRLQAQRGLRPNTTQSAAGEDGNSETASNANRQSVASNLSLRQGPQIHQDEEIPPPSRGTDFTEQDGLDRATANTSPTGHGTVQSMTESVRPLQVRSSNPRPTHLDLHKEYKQGHNMLSPPSKSPRSFRSSFLLPTKGDAQPSNETQGRERLSSGASSPRSARAKVQQEVKREVGHNYQYFAGNTVFCLGGRLQNARDRPLNVATGIIVILPGVLFFAFSAPWLWHNVSPAIPIIFAYIFYICVSSFVHASVTDPGILPRNLHPLPPPDSSEDPLALGPSLNDWVLVKSMRPTNAAMEVPIKYCKTCNIWRPPRAHHCRVCDSCVETQDHHCVWLNNCVGRRNYRYFFTFVSSGTIISLFLIGASLGHCLKYMAMEGISFREAINECRVPFALVLYGALALPYPSTLFAYHLYLTARGETTRELLNSRKFLKKDRHRPFSQGSIFSNWVAVLIHPRPPTYLHFKRKYEEGDQRFGPRRGKPQAPLVPEQQGGGMEMQNVGGGSPAFQGPMHGAEGTSEEGHTK